ncbi:MAG: HD domain-containing protein [Magnetovibrio sp.]|nr:HD domain-containing protein [Magnetovibrio sp.]
MFIIDNLPPRIQKIKTLFAEIFDIRVFSNGALALQAMLDHRPIGVVSDDRTLSTDGSHLHRLKCSHVVLKHIPFFITSDAYQGSYRGSNGEGSADYFFKRPVNFEVLLQVVLRVIQKQAEHNITKPRANACVGIATAQRQPGKGDFISLARDVANHRPMNKQVLKCTWNPLLDCIKDEEHKLVLEALRNYSSEFYTHSLRVAVFMAVFAKLFKANKQETILLTAGGYMLDLGIMLLPLALLNKPEVFSVENQAMMNKHVHYSQEILETLDSIDPLIFEIASLHHERLDGSGYPKGLTGPQINQLGRIAAISDVFAALTDKRPHRPPFSVHEAFEKMHQMDKALDQDLLKLFQEKMDL